MDDTPTESKPMEYLILAGFLAAWFVLQVWVLPRTVGRS